MSIKPEDLRLKGGAETSDLTKILQTETSEAQYSNAKTSYYNLNDMINFLNRNKDFITVLSLNIESINAKFDELNYSLKNLKNQKLISVSYVFKKLSETCCLEQLALCNYKMTVQYSNPHCTIKGGLVTYVRNNLNVNNIEHVANNTWEGTFIDIRDEYKTCLTVGNIYRPPKLNNNHASIHMFLQEFCPIINNIVTRSKNLILAGDFNIDILKVNSNESFHEFYDFVTGHNLVPNIILPTRLSKHNATLIDHIYSKTSNSINPIETGILAHKIPDHMATFTSVNIYMIIQHENRKRIKYRSFTGSAVDGFLN